MNNLAEFKSYEMTAITTSNTQGGMTIGGGFSQSLCSKGGSVMSISGGYTINNSYSNDLYYNGGYNTGSNDGSFNNGSGYFEEIQDSTPSPILPPTPPSE